MIEVCAFSDPDTVRLIPAAYINEPAILPLVDDREELDIITALEGMTSSRASSFAIPAGVDPAELLNEHYGYGYTLINAAFCHARPPGNRFNNEDRGAWYCAFGPNANQTAQAEVLFHRTRALEEAGCFYDIGQYRQLLAGFSCSFHDVRTVADHPCLQPDPRVAYPIGQALAKSILAGGGNGILYPSVRFSGGECIAVLRPSVIQNVRQGAHITFEWTGRAVPHIIEQPVA
ncbi:hypothetical protein H4S14_002953 [Agrobacterium vitis]|nr:hypothetical protein [Agrobacterium vitis]MBE1439191.1 hypothetical protein [Agrobacterium vitis]